MEWCFENKYNKWELFVFTQFNIVKTLGMYLVYLNFMFKFKFYWTQF
jgi:hypothetical protein